MIQEIETREPRPDEMWSARVKVVPGTQYWKKVYDLDKKRLRFVGPYTVQGMARHTENGQEMVVFANGAGTWQASPLAYFLTNFQRVTPDAPDKVAGRISEGNPW